MLTAEQAREKSAMNQNPYAKYLNDILVWIGQHADISLTEFKTPMNRTWHPEADLSQNEEAIEYLKSELEALGYVVSYEDKTTNIIVEWK